MERDYKGNKNYSNQYNYGNHSGYNDYYGQLELKADWEIPIRGPLTFIIAIMTIITNALLISVFIFRSHRSPTTIVLTSLAISDTIICLTRLPESIYFNMAGNYKNLYMTYDWCVTNHVLYVIYSIFRMTSNWFTALLGWQRLLAVCTPFYYSRICNAKTTIIKVAVIVIIAVIVYQYEAFGIKRSMMVYYIFSGFLTRLLPVIILFITTVALALLLHQRSIRFKTSDSYKKEQLRRINMLVIVILVVFLVAEIQDGITFLIYAHELATDQIRGVLSEEADILWHTISSAFSLLSYACNFWIFFLMSTQFRASLLDMLQCRIKRVRGMLNLESTDGKTNSSFTNVTIRNDRSTTTI
ncbi:medium-wave-sensitive opsin 1-like [Crassostrea angulata]|uniref:medium-wave-sensitive opsin 1-like n=1 Tax=Magallana angulata TaxID=2784310 RepID=UPI0022B15060|nr:medium-wave-sensitive opsin 1-like [Crassostrea angulata]